MSAENQSGLPSPLHVFWHVESAQKKKKLLLMALPTERSPFYLIMQGGTSNFHKGPQ